MHPSSFHARGPPLASPGGQSEVPWGERLDAVGAGGLGRRALERFLAGVLLEEDGSTSAPVVAQLLRWFLLGTPGLPAAGMGALPAQLAGGLRQPVALGQAAHRVLPVHIERVPAREREG